MKPRASASFCHWPNESSTPDGHVGPSCVSRPDFRRATTSPAPARSTAATTAGSSSIRGTSPKPTVCPARNSKRKKSWNPPPNPPVCPPRNPRRKKPGIAPAGGARHSAAGTRASGVSSTKIEPEDGSYIFASSLTSVVLPAPFSPTMATTAPTGSVNDTSSSTTRDVPGYANDTCSSRMPRCNTVGTARSPNAANEAAQSSSHASRRDPSIQNPRRNPISPTVAPIYADSRAPAASTRSTALAGARRPDDTNTTAPTYAKPKTAHASACHSAEPHRAAATGPYQHSHAHRRSVIRRSPIPVTRTSFPDGAVVAMLIR